MAAAILILALLQAAAPMRSIDKGSDSGVDEARQVIVRSAEEWTNLWRIHGLNREQPKIDFGRDMIVGVFLGSRPTAGFDIEIAGTREDQGALVVQYRERRPPRGTLTAQVLTAPFHLVAVGKRAGEVKFERVE
jgi:hypothetical protein